MQSICMEIETLASQNPWWKTANWEVNDRHLSILRESKFVYERLGNVPQKKGVMVVYGPRQVGNPHGLKWK